MDREPRHLILPEAGQVPSSTIALQSVGPAVIIGANGSGKTRLGVWIEFESEQKDKVHRISAQKSLSMPETTATPSVDIAKERLLFGDPRLSGYGTASPETLLPIKLQVRWQRNPSTSLLDDFGSLLQYLFADDYDESTKYRQAAGRNAERIEPPETKIDVVKRIWEKVLPHRTLEIGGNRVDVAFSGEPGSMYAATDMSDGERVVFYLIGQALSAPEDGILLIDEPELHLHRSIQANLWDEIEAERPDCLFVYLTHDLDFAASRVAAAKVCLKGYDGRGWDWFEVPENDEIPEEVLLEILGSRKPVIFVEGDKGSLDYFLYQKIYPGFTIAPCGGSGNVVHATQSFSSFEHLHRHISRGIIDRDFRDDREVTRLRGLNVFVLDYSEIEHLLLAEDVLRAVAKHQGQEAEFPSRFEEVKSIVFREMRNNKELLISSVTASKVQRKLKNYEAKARGKAALKSAFNTLTASVDVDVLFDSTAADVEKIIDDEDYAGALRTYNNKGLLPQIAPVFGFTPQGFMDFVKSNVSGEGTEDLATALRAQAPSIPA